MFLVNKHTGEAIEWERNITYKVGKTYKSLKEFLEDWEDATVISTRELEDLRRVYDGSDLRTRESVDLSRVLDDTDVRRVYDDALRAGEKPCEN